MDLAAMKKVALMTLREGSNYGNALQHVAMVLLLRDLGVEVETLRDSTVCGFADPLPKESLRRRLRPGHIWEVLRYRLLAARRRKCKALQTARKQRFDAFLQDYVVDSEVSLSNASFSDSDMLRVYAAFVTGSDQVWNPLYTHTSSVRFLQFAPQEQRIAYAPSFGVQEIPEIRKELYAKWIADIPHLSVREESGARIIAELTGRQAPVVLDPTLCIDAAVWEHMGRAPADVPQNPYVLCYFLGEMTRQYRRDIHRLAAQRGLEIIELQNPKKSIEYQYDPAEFLWLIAHANLFCTDSFHGVAFSVLFRKPFAAFVRAESGYKSDDRIGTLLGKLSITGGYVDRGKYVPPDYSALDGKLLTERETSIAFLREAMEKAQGGRPK
ncbi:MAG: polysaccharide pyruvyl transferase family protein [Clostridiales bacterium]|nr:polysaccharide pyruvyl transferase family protein [Clostridiales bacterium]